MHIPFVSASRLAWHNCAASSFWRAKEGRWAGGDGDGQDYHGKDRTADEYIGRYGGGLLLEQPP
jgi:hypothetical protein